MKSKKQLITESGKVIDLIQDNATPTPYTLMHAHWERAAQEKGQKIQWYNNGKYLDFVEKQSKWI